MTNEHDAAGLPSSVSVSGLTPSTAPETDTESGNDDSGELRALIATHVRMAINTWHLRYDPADDHGESLDESIAAALVRSGFRRVSVDDDTVERLAIVLAKTEGVILAPEDLRSPPGVRSLWAAKFASMARAAVQALRDGGE